MPQSRLAEIPGRLFDAPAHTLAEIERICDALKVAVIDARELSNQRHHKSAAFEGAVRHAREMHTLLLETMLPLEPLPHQVRAITDAVGVAVQELEQIIGNDVGGAGT